MQDKNMSVVIVLMIRLSKTLLTNMQHCMKNKVGQKMKI